MEGPDQMRDTNNYYRILWPNAGLHELIDTIVKFLPYQVKMVRIIVSSPLLAQGVAGPLSRLPAWELKTRGYHLYN